MSKLTELMVRTLIVVGNMVLGWGQHMLKLLEGWLEFMNKEVEDDSQGSIKKTREGHF